jgi:hypothetical protein
VSSRRYARFLFVVTAVVLWIAGHAVRRMQISYCADT